MDEAEALLSATRAEKGTRSGHCSGCVLHTDDGGTGTVVPGNFTSASAWRSQGQALTDRLRWVFQVKTERVSSSWQGHWVGNSRTLSRNCECHLESFQRRKMMLGEFMSTQMINRTPACLFFSLGVSPSSSRTFLPAPQSVPHSVWLTQCVARSLQASVKPAQLSVLFILSSIYIWKPASSSVRTACIARPGNVSVYLDALWARSRVINKTRQLSSCQC